MDATALICISTPQDNLNFYSEMFTMKGPDGKELFRSIQVGLACAACLAAGKGDSCTHNEDEIPPWKSREKFDLIKSLYGDRKDLLMRESVGAITEDQSSLFPTHWVDSMFDNQVPTSLAAVRHVIIACDPNGGGDSHMAIVSCAFLFGQMQIIGLDSHAVRGHDEIETLLMAHVKQLRKRLPHVWFIFVAESNLGQEADHMAFMLKNEGFVHTVTENGLAGVRTTNKRKELYSMELSKFMSQSACKLDKNVTVANPFGTTKESTLQSFRKQMLGYRKILLKSTTGRSEPRVCYTGKSQGANDDLVVTLTICAYWGVQFYSKRIASVPYDIISAL
tara:strand:+ start:320 stop:1324 length:1005 start_codon:yes stop_codon:yes gene_type:complete